MQAHELLSQKHGGGQEDWGGGRLEQGLIMVSCVQFNGCLIAILETAVII